MRDGLGGVFLEKPLTLHSTFLDRTLVSLLASHGSPILRVLLPEAEVLVIVE